MRYFGPRKGLGYNGAVAGHIWPGTEDEAQRLTTAITRHCSNAGGAAPAFADGAPIPRMYAGKGVGDNVSPPLQWTGVPPGAQQLALVMDDVVLMAQG